MEPIKQATTDLGESDFRIRGKEITRLETFVDAAFAFTLTLLVISFDNIPKNVDELVNALKGAPSFAASFATIAMFWMPHRAWSRHFGLDDRTSTLISFLLVFIILIYVFPLRALVSLAFNFMTSGWAPTEFVINDIAEMRFLFVIYGIGFSACCLCIALLNRHALSLKDTLELSAAEIYRTRAIVISWLIVASAGVLSCILAMTLPQPYISIAGFSYMILGVIMPLYGRHVRKQQKKRPA